MNFLDKPVEPIPYLGTPALCLECRGSLFPSPVMQIFALLFVEDFCPGAWHGQPWHGMAWHG